jgi:hypothetical protein
VSIASGYLWLAFPEQDQCYFAFMEARLDEPLELDGKDYALIVQPKFENRLRRLTGAGFERYHLIGELCETAYGNFNVYYTGKDPTFLALTPKREYLFGWQRGLVSDEQLASAEEVWSAGPLEISLNSAVTPLSVADPGEEEESARPSKATRSTDIAKADLKSSGIFQLLVDLNPSVNCEFLLVDDETGSFVQRISRASIEHGRAVSVVFRTTRPTRLRISIEIPARRDLSVVRISNISIREVRMPRQAEQRRADSFGYSAAATYADDPRGAGELRRARISSLALPPASGNKDSPLANRPTLTCP